MLMPVEFLEEVRLRLPLSEYIGRSLPLKKAGKELVGLCPFHNEKSPSFTVNDEKGFFHCFGCGAHGDIIGFVMQSQNMGFLDSCESLARIAGLEVPAASPEEHGRFDHLKQLRSATDRAALLFQQQLQSPGGQPARDYLFARGFTWETITKMRIGWAPSKTGEIVPRLREFAPDVLQAAGLIRRLDDGSIIEYFRGRVMFPISDRCGNVVAFGGRVLGDTKPKYLNSPETPIYHKGSMLYNYSSARVVAASRQPVIIVEGYTDTLALTQNGWSGALAPCGTTLTAQQLTEIWKIAAEPILCFNGDLAGIRATERAIETALPLLGAGRSLQIARLPQGQDCDTLMRRNGKDAMVEVFAGAVPMAEAIWQIEQARIELTTPERRAELGSRLEKICSTIADAAVAGEYRKTFKAKLSPRRRGRAPDAPVTGAARMRHQQQEMLLAMLYHHPELLGDRFEEISALILTSPDLDRVRQVMLNSALDGTPQTQELHDALCHVDLDWAVERFISPELRRMAPFTAPCATGESVSSGWNQLYNMMSRQASRSKFSNMKVPQDVDFGLTGTAD